MAPQQINSISKDMIWDDFLTDDNMSYAVNEHLYPHISKRNVLIAPIYV